MDDAVAHFMSITDQTPAVAQGFLSMTEGDVMAAVNMFFENPELASSFPEQGPANPASSASAGAAAGGAASASSRPQAASRSIGRQDSSGVIHIDSDDGDDDIDIPDLDSDEDNTNYTSMQRIAQETDDEAMARRLQEEMYGESAANPDGVRAPIARTTETLVGPGGFGGGDDDDFRLPSLMDRRRAPQRE